MKRYDIASQIKDDSEKRKLSTIIISASPDTTDTVIRTSTPQRLDKLALDFYADASLWWIIATVNQLGKGTLIVPRNTTIRIPDKERVLSEIEQKNKTR
tara:strand:- start:756 stop:1052 length:297 start_codon:yes stop_codon:yes gene_type:complete